jgi:imidazolonepropionase
MRKMISAGCRVAIATDYNPGSSVFQSMPQMLQLAMANGGLTLEEVMLAGTYNAAMSVDMKDSVGESHLLSI